MKYRKLPVEIEAFRWTGDHTQTEDPEWCIDQIKLGKIWFTNSGTPDVAMIIETLEGSMQASQGDYIVKGVKGEIYPCKPDIFEMTYELVSEPRYKMSENKDEQYRELLTECLVEYERLYEYIFPNNGWIGWTNLEKKKLGDILLNQKQLMCRISEQLNDTRK